MEENKLQTLNNNNLTIDSREVAEMLGVKHGKILEKLEGTKDGKTKGIIPTMREHEIGFSEYFIESSYKTEGNNKTYKCYLCTKLGCDFLANKFTGEKGILFTAKYVKRFNEMEQQIKQENTYTLPQTYKEALLQLVEQVELNEKLQLENENMSIENRLLQGEKFEWAGRSLINAMVRQYSTTVYNDFSKGWIEFKKSLLYTYGININSRITNYLNSTGKKTKPKTLDMLKTDEEVSQGIITILTMCKDSEVNIDNIIKHFKEDN